MTNFPFKFGLRPSRLRSRKAEEDIVEEQWRSKSSLMSSRRTQCPRSAAWCVCACVFAWPTTPLVRGNTHGARRGVGTGAGCQPNYVRVGTHPWYRALPAQVSAAPSRQEPRVTPLKPQLQESLFKSMANLNKPVKPSTKPQHNLPVEATMPSFQIVCTGMRAGT